MSPEPSNLKHKSHFIQSQMQHCDYQEFFCNQCNYTNSSLIIIKGKHYINPTYYWHHIVEHSQNNNLFKPVLLKMKIKFYVELKTLRGQIIKTAEQIL